MSRLTLLVSGLAPTSDENGFNEYASSGMIYGPSVVAHYTDDLQAIVNRQREQPGEVDAVGHSLGAAAVLALSEKIKIRRLVLIDYVDWSWVVFNPFAWFGTFKVNPDQVGKALSINKSFGLPPALKISNTIDGRFVNKTVSTWNHGGMPAMPEVKNLVAWELAQ